MTSPPGAQPDFISTGRPADIRVSKSMKHRVAGALATATGMSFATARRIVSQRAGDSVDELEAWLQLNYRLDPTGVTAVRLAMRSVR